MTKTKRNNADIGKALINNHSLHAAIIGGTLYYTAKQYNWDNPAMIGIAAAVAANWYMSKNGHSLPWNIKKLDLL